MSVFDTIHCDYPLPDPEYQNEEFQTKDLDSTLDRYRIGADGRLWRLPRKIAPFAKDTPPADAVDTPEDMNYHGELCFYTDTDKGWLEYDARFTYGTVDWIRRAGEPEPVSTDSLERLARNAGALEQERRTRLVAFFDRLESLDAAVARQALETFGDRARAASWLGRALRQFGDQNSYEMLAQGQRREVLEALTQIDYGFFA